MADPPNGVFFDELSKVRVLEPEISQQTQELKGECKDFVDSEYETFFNGIIFIPWWCCCSYKYAFWPTKNKKTKSAKITCNQWLVTGDTE